MFRVLEPDELRAAHALQRSTLHSVPPGDAEWETLRGAFAPGRTHGSFSGDLLIGTARSTPALLTVPGGGRLSASAIAGVGVRVGSTRRGVLTALVRAQLEEAAAHGETVALLRASEGAIYSRFGFGVATRGCSYVVNRGRATLHDRVLAGGETEVLLDTEEQFRRLPSAYEGLTLRRAGTINRSPYYWRAVASRAHHADKPVVCVLHHGIDGVDGMATYTVSQAWSAAHTDTLRVSDIVAANPQALAGLWRFLLSVDLVDQVEVWLRPLDEPMELMLTDPRACRFTRIFDELWLRLVDVGAALAARDYGDAAAVVLDVRDALLPDNAGRYQVGPEGVRRTDRPAQLVLDVGALSALYLGDRTASALCSAGLLCAPDPDAVATADRLFALCVPPWCGTVF